MHTSRLLVVFGFIFLGVLSRILPHPPNFTAISALSLFGACYTGSLGLSLGMVLSTMFLSDCVLGFHSLVPFVYFTIGLISVMGRSIDQERPMLHLPACCVASSFLFFVIVNFGVWFSDNLYPKTLAGLEMCYVAAIPFLMTQILGDLFYGILIFSFFRLFERTYRKDALRALS